MKQITVTITSSESVILRIERFLALLHLSSAWGHTCTAAMDIDGDGSEKVIVSGIDISAHARYVEIITRRPRTKSVDWVASEQEAVEHRVHLTGLESPSKCTTDRLCPVHNVWHAAPPRK